jgi:predicted dehydrogenase
MKKLRFAVLGAGFWSHYQLAAWHELKGVECVAVYNRTRARAEALAGKFGIPAVYDDADELLRREKLDFIDIITEIGGHYPLVMLAARHRVPVICQKPMAPDLKMGEQMVSACRRARIPFLIHENWRWQTPILALRSAVASGVIGRPFRARIDMISGFPVFDNQPSLKELAQFIITDLGSHTLDVARVLFGEADHLYCRTQRVQSGIKGEDIATIMMEMGERTTVTVNMAYAGNFLEHDRFPETYFFIEGEKGSIELGPDFWLRVTTKNGTQARRYPPPRYAWANPAYDVVHASLVPCNANILQAIRGKGRAETTGEDNLKTVRLVFAAYESAKTGRAIRFSQSKAAGR